MADQPTAPAYPRWIASMTEQERAEHFRYYTPEQFLEWMGYWRLPDKCLDPATLAKVARIVTGGEAA